MANEIATHVIKGVVDNVSTKTVTTRFGDKQVHHAKVDGIEFSTGFKQMVQQGEVINLPVAWMYGNWQYVETQDTIRDGLPQVTLAETQANAPAASAGSDGGGRKKGYGKFPVDPLDGQMSIIRQNSMNRAVEILENMMTATTPLFRPVDEEAYLKKLVEVALTITDFNSGQDIMQLKAAQAANLAAAS